MALDTNIALGIKPIEQPNMLAQMGQMMQLRQMQQGYESENALRDFYAQGGDLSTDEGKRRFMSKVGLKGAEIIDRQSQTRSRDVGTAEKYLELYKNQVGFIKTPEDAARWLTNFYRNPETRPYLESIAPMDVALAAIPTNDPVKFQEWLQNASQKSEKLFVDANTRANNAQSNINNQRTVGATIRGQDLTNARAMEGTWSKVIVGRRVMLQNSRTGEFREVQDPYDDKGGTVTVGPITNLPDTSTGDGVVTSGASSASVPTKPNMLPETVGATPSVNNLRNPPVVANAPVPKTRPPVTNPLMVEEKPVWNEKAGMFVYPPTEDNPKGRVVEVPAIQEAVQKRTANATLKVAGYNPKTQTDEVSNLIKESTSGLTENWANKVWSAISGTGSKGAEAIKKLETRANEMTLALAPNGSLGAGFSNEDRTFMLGKLGDVANPNEPMNVRLAAWEDVMERTARTAGVPYIKQSLVSSSAKSNPKVIQFGELPK